jgi:hypothetical protein
MWAGGKEVNEKGDPVLLLEPQSKKPNKSTNNSDACASFIGGTPIYFHDGDGDEKKHQQPICGICQQEMYLILQMYAPVDGFDRTMMVFGCNNASCIHSAMQQSSENNPDSDNSGAFRFCSGGKGVIRCIRSQRNQGTRVSVSVSNNEKKETKEKKAPESTWDDGMEWDNTDGGDWGEVNDGSNSWGVGDDNGDDKSTTSMDDLEAMLAAMESKDKEEQEPDNKKTVEKQPQKTVASAKDSGTGNVQVKAFPRYDLDVYDEPILAKRFGEEEGDSDDDDAVVTNDAEIQNLLSKYLKEEDDNYILSAIKGGAGNPSSGGGGVSGEKYEKAPPDERAFLAFTNRVKRAPKQSARYTYGGFPLWSM